MRRLPALILVLLTLLVSTQPALAQAAVEVSDAHADFNFGRQVVFSAHIQSPVSIREVVILFQSDGDPNTHVDFASLDADGLATYDYMVQGSSLRPFARVFFWYRTTLENGEIITSSRFFFYYFDNRFSWQNLEDDQIHLHWYTGDVAFGQQAFDVAHAGLKKINAILPAAPNPPIDIYIYASSVDLQEALSLGGHAWTAGQASPDLGTALVSIPPGPEQSMQMERQIPHELAHVILFERTGAGYPRLPAWLREGIASLSEIYPNANYPVALQNARQANALISMNDLCSAFPQDASRAFLAYAEADSFTRYVVATYGNPGLFNLLVVYSDGVECELGARRALGLSLSQLESRWRRAELGDNNAGKIILNILPYLVILVIIVILPFLRLRPAATKKGKTNG
jgi:hypothetical protein